MPFGQSISSVPGLRFDSARKIAQRRRFDCVWSNSAGSTSSAFASLRSMFDYFGLDLRLRRQFRCFRFSCRSNLWRTPRWIRCNSQEFATSNTSNTTLYTPFENFNGSPRSVAMRLGWTKFLSLRISCAKSGYVGPFSRPYKLLRWEPSQLTSYID